MFNSVIINKKSVFAFLFILCSHFSFSQEKAADTGKVEFIQNEKIKELVATHTAINQKTLIKGYRIKIHFGADKNKAKEVKAQFISKYPDVPAYEKYDQPNFNIRVGDFRTKLEAYKFLKEIQVDFPGAFLVQDNIEFPSLDVKAEVKK